MRVRCAAADHPPICLKRPWLLKSAGRCYISFLSRFVPEAARLAGGEEELLGGNIG